MENEGDLERERKQGFWNGMDWEHDNLLEEGIPGGPCFHAIPTTCIRIR